ncbi:hypothetical protein SDC9_212784 [bioreactor metagenome]|uniref:Uncharacterized protein n=1 Tax=bioreactor metagenome TaxID=1076179 RepID=A0A645JMW9_9ZZZZ
MLVCNGHAAADTVIDARRVGDDERWARIGFGFEYGFEHLVFVGAQRDLGNVDVAVAHGHNAEILLARLFAACRELRNSCCRGSL